MEIEVRKQKFSVSPNYDNTLMKTVVDGQEVSASTLPLLVKEIERLLIVPKAAIPVMKMEFPNIYREKNSAKIGFKRGVLTGVRAGNNNLMVRWEGSSGVEQMGGYRDTVLKDLTAEERDELVAAYKAKTVAYEAYEGLIKKHTINETTGRKLIKEYHLQREKREKTTSTGGK